MELTGHLLRHAATVVVHDAARPLTLAEVADELDRRGLRPAEPAPKRLSDGLRSQVRNGRVVRVGRGVFASGSMTDGTLRRWRGRTRVVAEYGWRHPGATQQDAVEWARRRGRWH